MSMPKPRDGWKPRTIPTDRIMRSRVSSRDGQILGKMGHTERYGENLFKNIAGEKGAGHLHECGELFPENKITIIKYQPLCNKAKCFTRVRPNRVS